MALKLDKETTAKEARVPRKLVEVGLRLSQASGEKDISVLTFFKSYYLWNSVQWDCCFKPLNVCLHVEAEAKG